jgi:hypothetical protein
MVAIDAGVAGASARRKFEQRKAARQAVVKGRLGNYLGGVILALTNEPQSTSAWEHGAIGEEQLGEASEGVKGVTSLHDRRVPGTRANIDHIVIAPAGVFVVDAKRYHGLIHIRDRGGLFRRDERLFVGKRDCSHLAEKMGWQIEAVQRVLRSAGSEFADVPVEPVLCFIDGEWPLLFPPKSYAGVHLEGKRSIKTLATRTAVLDPAGIERLARLLAAHLPAK